MKYELSPKERIKILAARLENLERKYTGATGETTALLATENALRDAERDLFLEQCETGGAA